VTIHDPAGQAGHTQRTRAAYDRLAAAALRLFPDELTEVAAIPSFIVYRLWLQPAARPAARPA
jgi:hypothetical protein